MCNISSSAIWSSCVIQQWCVPLMKAGDVLVYQQTVILIRRSQTGTKWIITTLLGKQQRYDIVQCKHKHWYPSDIAVLVKWLDYTCASPYVINGCNCMESPALPAPLSLSSTWQQRRLAYYTFFSSFCILYDYLDHAPVNLVAHSHWSKSLLLKKIVWKNTSVNFSCHMFCCDLWHLLIGRRCHIGWTPVMHL